MWPNCDAHITVAYVQGLAFSDALLERARRELIIQGRHSDRLWQASGSLAPFHREADYAAVCIHVSTGLHDSLHKLRDALGVPCASGLLSRKDAFHVSLRSPRGCRFDARTCCT